MKKYLYIFSFLICLLFISCSSENNNKYIDENMPKYEDTRSLEYEEATFETLNGDEVTYNKNTRNIVCVFGSQDVVSFGIKLLAYENSTDIRGYEDFYQGATQLVNSSPISVEEIVSFNPELILVNQAMNLTTIRALSKIAPTIPLYTDSCDFSERLSYIGRIFGYEDRANELIDYANNLNTYFMNLIDKIDVKDKTLTIYTYMNGISLPPDRGWYMNILIYDDKYLGLKRKDNVKEFMTDESDTAYKTISNENLTDYEGDLVFFGSLDDNSEISNYVTENPGWKRLKAVKEDRVGILNLSAYAQKGIILLYDQYMQIYQALLVATKTEIKEENI